MEANTAQDVMPEISIKDFSCIENASLDIKRLNVIIGPQGSGKSVITKLIYFFSDILPGSIRSSEDGLSLAEFKESLEKSFSVWFPPQAWGAKRFLINYSDGEFECRIIRRQIAKHLSDKVKISLSPWLEDTYQRSLSAFSEIKRDNIKLISANDLTAHSEMERSWRVRSKVRDEIENQTAGYAAFSQTFIPAGRAFFTSIGRLVAGIEHAGSLDPATLKFARLFANWRDRSSYYLASGNVEELHDLRRSTMLGLFGGMVQNKREAEYIEMTDGRKVPFSSLSSGQQELLPIWYFLDNLMIMDAMRGPRRGKSQQLEREIIYIEEPEAHLFPASQSALLDMLIAQVLGINAGLERKLIITTHSPYIMSRLNVLLKAGQLSRRKKRNKDIGEIVPRHSWIMSEEISVQSLNDGRLNSIMDEEENLIDAHFLDSISDVISRDFSNLLDIEEAI